MTLHCSRKRGLPGSNVRAYLLLSVLFYVIFSVLRQNGSACTLLSISASIGKLKIAMMTCAGLSISLVRLRLSLQLITLALVDIQFSGIRIFRTKILDNLNCTTNIQTLGGNLWKPPGYYIYFYILYFSHCLYITCALCIYNMLLNHVYYE